MGIYTRLAPDTHTLQPDSRMSPGTASVVSYDNGESDAPLLGISYYCNGRAEEERGATELHEAFRDSADPDAFLSSESVLNACVEPSDVRMSRASVKTTQARLVCQDDDVVVFSVSPPLVDSQHLRREREIARARHSIALYDPYAQGVSRPGAHLHQASRSELLAMAKERQIKGRSRMNVAALIQAIHVRDNPPAPTNPHTHAGWFHYGEMLVLPRTDDLFGRVLDLLVEAALAGFLWVGTAPSAAMGVFGGGGITLLDERDLSDEARAAISARNEAYREDMEALAPVAAQVAERHGYYALGSPRRVDGEPTRYWLNGHSVRTTGTSGQPYGWYSLEELRTEKYIEDLSARA